MNRLIFSLLPGILLLNSTYAAERVFSLKTSPPDHSIWPGIAALLVCLPLFVFFLKNKGKIKNPNVLCHLLEKKYLGNKTVLYVIRCGQEHFVLADNQQALSVHSLRIPPESMN